MRVTRRTFAFIDDRAKLRSRRCGLRRKDEAVTILVAIQFPTRFAH
jgi:hypothetical protein